MSASSYALALLAGLLTTLSPCVLPLIPIVVAGAAAAHRLGPVALAGGLTVTFVGVGLFVAVIGFSIGLDAEFFQLVAGVLMIAIGVVLLSAPLQQRFAHAGGGIANAAQALIDRMAPTGGKGSFS